MCSTDSRGAIRKDDIDLQPSEIGRGLGELRGVADSPAVFKRNLLALDPPLLGKLAAEDNAPARGEFPSYLQAFRVELDRYFGNAIPRPPGLANLAAKPGRHGIANGENHRTVP